MSGMKQLAEVRSLVHELDFCTDISSKHFDLDLAYKAAQDLLCNLQVLTRNRHSKGNIAKHDK